MELIQSKIIGVEGNDELNFFTALFKHLNIDGVQLIDFGGKDNFSNRIKQIVKLDNFDNVTHFGLIRDADTNYEGALRSIIQSLEKAKLPIPEKNESFSLKAKPKVGIFIMPGKNKTGMLESLCIETIQNNPEYECINNFIDCLNEKPKTIEKAIIQIYLASKTPIVNSLGLGAIKGHIDFDNKQMVDLRNFILEFVKPAYQSLC